MYYKYIVILFVSLIRYPSWASSSLPLTSLSEHYKITAQPIEKSIKLNKIQSWSITIKDNTGAPVQGLSFEVNGGMPTHQHGFPTQPKLIQEAMPGEYIIDGLKFNMTGRWEIELINLKLTPPLNILIELDLDHENAK
ncbi:FixH family protein [Photobacterium nomapromontoriensis]|uniref:FixH family protein n=1 Tax=Photobacterium nomapromontoriensis TaxID=2910237 RepID=UPI003D1433BD